MTKDPVCGMNVEEQNAAARVEYQGIAYYFCSERCHKQFTAHPERYVAKNPDKGLGGHTHRNE